MSVVCALHFRLNPPFLFYYVCVYRTTRAATATTPAIMALVTSRPETAPPVRGGAEGLPAGAFTVGEAGVVVFQRPPVGAATPPVPVALMSVVELE